MGEVGGVVDGGIQLYKKNYSYMNDLICLTKGHLYYSQKSIYSNRAVTQLDTCKDQYTLIEASYNLICTVEC